MNKELEKELNKLLPEGYKVSVKLELARYFQDKAKGRYSIYFDVTKEPTKEQLLEKAERDYVDGQIVECLHDKEEEVVADINIKFDSEGDLWLNGNLLIYKKGKWAKIIKTPVIKVQNKHLYENDEYWELYKDNYILKKQVAQKGISEHYETKDFERFLTKEAALDYVMAEVKRRFEGKILKSPSSFASNKVIKDIKIHITDGEIIFDNVWLWSICKGFNNVAIAEPIKEAPLKLGAFSDEQMEKAYNDGIKAEQQRCGEFDIENYR